MQTLLRFAALVCGEAAARSVFAPLIADWQREWEVARASPRARIRIALSGSVAVATALVICLVTGGFKINRHALGKGLLALALSSLALVALQFATLPPPMRDVWIVELEMWIAFSRALTFMIPLAVLPVMMLWRGLRLSSRSASIVMLGAASLSILIAGWLVPKTQGEPPFSDYMQERMHQHAIEEDGAARFTYPGSALRALRTTTPEQRAEARRRQRTDPRYLAFQAEQRRARWNIRTFVMGGLTLALGVMGWALGALGRTRPRHAAAWWTLTGVTLMFLDGQFVFWINTAAMRQIRATPWAPLALFGTAAALLLVSSYFRRGLKT